MKASKGWALNSLSWRVCPVSSMSPIVSATAEFLNTFRKSEVSGGMTMRRACGRITYR
ncbi:hypothetical protein D9M69_616750 [compost metagenome]